MSAEFVLPDWMTPAEPPPRPDGADVDPHQVEALVNRFIAAKHEALFEAPDAYYRTTGADAVSGAPDVLGRLDALRTAMLEAAGDDGTRFLLGPQLDAHLDDVRDGVSRHVTRQQDELARQIISERQQLIQCAATLEHDNDDKLGGLAEAHASAAQALARMDGQPEGPAIEAARSAIWRTVIDHRLANGNGAQALTLFDRVKDQLAPADRLSLDTPLQVARASQTADQWISRQTATDGLPLQDRAVADPDLPPDVKLIVRARLDAGDSATESKRVATSKALDDEIADSMRALATSPNDYAPGTFGRIARAYDTAGEPDKAEATRRLAVQEAALVPFTRASVKRQQRLIDDLPEGGLRDAALAIQRHQAAAFAADAFAAGTTLYPDVGPPASTDDVKGRLQQARYISGMRSIYVTPYTADEAAEMRRILAEGSPDEQQTVRARLDAMPEEIRGTIEPAAPDIGSEPPSTAPAGATTANPLEGADVHVVHQDDGSAKVIASGVQTPAGPADVSFSADRERRSATAETVLPDGRRVESRRTTPDGRSWSQIDTVRDADGTVRATLTTTFDGTRYSQTYAPADGESRTETWNPARDPDPPIQRVGYDDVLPYAAMGAVAGIAAIATAPVAAAAGLLGLALLALSLKGDTQDQGKAASIETKPPPKTDGEGEGEGEGEEQRPGIAHNSGKAPEPNDNEKPPPGSNVPVESAPNGLSDPDKERREIERASGTIGRGHAYQKHVIDQGEFPEIHSPEDFAKYIEKIMKNPTHKKSRKEGRTIYWDDTSGTIVLRNPKDPDGGTAFRPRDGKAYFDKQ